MAQLKTATGTDQTGGIIAVVMEDSEERSRMAEALKQEGFCVYCFQDEKEYGDAALRIQFDATLARGKTSAEVGLASKLPGPHSGKYCLVNGHPAVIDLLGLRTIIGYCLEPGYSREDLIWTVRQMLREP